MGSGGGGSSGKVEWPTYFQNWHSAILGSSISFNTTMVNTINSATAANPFSTQVAYDPSLPLGRMATEEAKVIAVADALNASTDLTADVATVETLVGSNLHDNASLSAPTDFATDAAAAVVFADANMTGTTQLLASETAFDAELDDKYTVVTLPRFQLGMQDINAVVSSAFVVGTAYLEADVIRQKAKYSADLRLQNFRDRNTIILDLLGKKLGLRTNYADIQNKRNGIIAELLQGQMSLRTSYLEFRRAIAALAIEKERIYIVALKEASDRNTEIAEAYARWPLTVMEAGGNLLAAGHGGTTQSGLNKASAAASVIGGSLSGAASGAMMGSMVGPYGTAIGAGIGAVAGGVMGYVQSR